MRDTRAERVPSWGLTRTPLLPPIAVGSAVVASHRRPFSPGWTSASAATASCAGAQLCPCAGSRPTLPRGAVGGNLLSQPLYLSQHVLQRWLSLTHVRGGFLWRNAPTCLAQNVRSAAIRRALARIGGSWQRLTTGTAIRHAAKFAQGGVPRIVGIFLVRCACCRVFCRHGPARTAAIRPRNPASAGSAWSPCRNSARQTQIRYQPS